ncbi:GAF domain-containing sensor histidine kinase [Leptolyngbya sp. FACHB-36]|uniref:GAF domain-containing sensor histidine kinase n=1 Tax=Leptolyngbya sp. FACHB-36 TaxID=2692808 RepID=UPI00168022E6|nr:GAF domain-containing sensor histidine kinase [Leptolyngbya sp. FACHB-36]MBD2020990.1 GAF domain-containing sensor histidine kinase [Leptolyngbya sp. FACHB-36]
MENILDEALQASDPSCSEPALPHWSSPNSSRIWQTLLQGVAEATRVLLTSCDRVTAINQALAILGQVTQVDRVYIFEYHPHPETGEPAMSRRFEWVDAGILPQLANPLLQNFCYGRYGLEDWQRVVESNHSVSVIIRELPGMQRQLFESFKIQSMLLVPIPVHGKLWGVMGFSDCHTERQWSPDEEAALMTLAATLGGVVAYRQLSAALDCDAHRDRLLGEMAQRIRRSLDLQQILDTTVAEVREFLGADRVHIISFDSSKTMVLAESVDDRYRSIREWTPLADNHVELIEAYFVHGCIDVINDSAGVTLPPVIAQDFVDFQVRAGIAVPLTVTEQLYGLLVVTQCTGPREWQRFEIDLLEQLSTQVAIAIQQAKLYEELRCLNTDLEQQVEQRTQELRQQYAELQDLQALKDEFLHAFSHDLRTPVMGTLLVMSNLLRKQTDSTIAVPRAVLERVIHSGQHQLSLINSLLEAHSSDVRGITLHYEPLHLHKLIQAIVGDLDPLLLTNQATLVNRVLATLPPVTADPLQLRRVYENLLTNALNHNRLGLELVLDATIEDDMLRCIVQDNGAGMEADMRDHLFERYARGSRSQSTGVGLGLYLCRQIITAHGGQIGVTGDPGAGSRFWFTLPLAGAVSKE